MRAKNASNERELRARERPNPLEDGLSLFQLKNFKIQVRIVKDDKRLG
jgi:hypothetical protein